jgi:hypothetical protein
LRRVVLESPFGADPNRFVPYGRAAIADSIKLGEAPMAMHLLYTQPGVLNDRVPADRAKGMEAAFAWYAVAEAIVVYRDFGISNGMQAGIDLGIGYGLPIEYRSLRGKGVLPDVFNPFPEEIGDLGRWLDEIDRIG